MADCFYVTLGPDILRNSSLCTRKRVKFQTSGAKVFLEILSDLVRKYVAEFNWKFYYFQYATLEMFKGAFNDYSMLKLGFFIDTQHFLQCILKTSPISIMQLIWTPNHIFYLRIAPK